MSRSDCGEPDNPPGANTPSPPLRRSARLLSKQQELLKKNLESSLTPLPTTTPRELSSSGIQQQISIRSSCRCRLQSTSSVASSSASSVLGESTPAAYPETTLPRKGRQRPPSYSPEQYSKKFRRTSERGRRKEKEEGKTYTKEAKEECHLEGVDGEKHRDSSPLRQKSLQRIGSSSVKSPERKVTGKRTRSSNSDNHSPPAKRKKTSSSCESKSTASSGSRKRPRRKVDPQENIDSGSSGPETSSKKTTKPKSAASAEAVTTKSTSVKSAKAVKRTRRSRAKVKRGEDITVISDSDSSPVRPTTTTSATTKRRRGKSSKLQHSDTKPVTKEKSERETQPALPKDRTEGICIPTNHFYSLPPFPEFARLTMASEG